MVLERKSGMPREVEICWVEDWLVEGLGKGERGLTPAPVRTMMLLLRWRRVTTSSIVL